MLAPWPIGDKRTCRSDLCNNAGLGYCATRVTDATMADVLLAGMVLLALGAWLRWGRFRGEENLNKRRWFPHG